MAGAKRPDREGHVRNDRVEGYGGNQSQFQWLGGTLVHYQISSALDWQHTLLTGQGESD